MASDPSPTRKVEDALPRIVASLFRHLCSPPGKRKKDDLVLCTMYKFKSTGWRNISAIGFLGAIAVGSIVLFLGMTTENEENEELRIEGYYRTLRNVRWREVETMDLCTSRNYCLEHSAKHFVALSFQKAGVRGAEAGS